MIERKTFTFDGENSADYGLYISGDSVYNAPNREIDMVSIPGRNGQLAIDMGRYENITVTYPAFVIADTQAEFREKIRRIRNWLCSKTSYQRLTDDYNPESFRLGLYKSGLEVEPIFYNRCGEFKMSFDCQPQRFLFTGEEVFTLGEWGETETYSGSIASFEGTETTAVKSLKANITPKQSGSGDPSPSNVRPISGVDTVAVTRAGKNVGRISQEIINNDRHKDGITFHALSSTKVKITGTSTAIVYMTSGYPISSPYLRLLKKGTYTFSNGVKASGINGAYVTGYPVSGGASRNLCNNIHEGQTATFTIAEDFYINIQMLIASGYTANDEVWFQLEEGTSATPYEPYNGTTYTTSLGQTVYGGTLDVVSGVLTIDKALVDLGSLSWSRYSSASTYTYRARISDMNATTTERNSGLISSAYTLFYGLQLTALDNNTMLRFGGEVFIRDDRYTDATAFKTAMNGVQLVYELATPTEITLTPTQVTTLLGNNNIWADSGTVEVEIGENPYILVNPTKFEACPIFEVEGAGTLSIGDTTLTISNTGTTIIDTEMMEAYEDDNGAIISRNDDVEGGFPTLTSGINNVEADGLTSVKVTPKFWEL